MGREFRHALADMLSAIDGIAAATHRKIFAEFEPDWLLRHGVQRGIEIISEASRALPDAIRGRRPEIPWAKVRGIGNVLRHEYHGLSDALVWRVATNEMPRLRIAIVALQAHFR